MLSERWTVRLTNEGLRLAYNLIFPLWGKPQTMRKNFDRLNGVSAEALCRKYPKLRLEELDLGGVRAESLQVEENPTTTIFYSHGGGYFAGSIRAYRRNALRLAYRTKARVILYEYRLAPEHPFPAAIDDAYAAWNALREKFPGQKFVFGGDSAGGGLTLALLLRLRDAKEPLPLRAFTICAFTDLTGSQPSYDRNRWRDVWLHSAHVQRWAPWYAKGVMQRNPYASPIFGDFTGIPPLLLMVGDQETLLDDTLHVAAAATDDGCQVELSVAEKMQHDWMFAAPWLAESKAAMAEISDFVGRA